MKKKIDNPGALFIPAGVILGMGLGFLMDAFLAWMFIGLGAGFVAFAIISIIQKK